MATATSFSADATPASIEFSLLESWLASSGALQLPLHQIESQQQARGREVQRLLLQAHLQKRGNGDVGPALQLELPDGEGLYSHHRLWNRGTRPYGLLPAGRTEHFSARPGAGIAGAILLLRTPAPFGQGRRAEPVLGIGPDHRRVDRRFRLQTQSGRDPAGCSPRFRRLLPEAVSGYRRGHDPGGRG